jgi:hypothetical protein
MLTKRDRQVAAECARRYPLACGGSFFSNRHIDMAEKAASLLLQYPEEVYYG